MRAAAVLALLALRAPSWGAGKAKPEELREEVEVKGKASAGPSIQVPAPGAHKPVVDEVIRSLDLYKTERRPGAARGRIANRDERLERPFPEPPFLVLTPGSVSADYDRWTFEILDGDRAVWRTEGLGRLQDRIEWDGTGLSTPDGTVRVGRPYAFRFTGEGTTPFVLVSDPVVLKSFALKDTIGATRLELDAAAVFEPKSSELDREAERYLGAMGERMRRVHSGDEPFLLTLSAAKPEGKLAAARARRLKRHFAAYLVANPERVKIEISAAGERGEVLSCDLPPEGGQSIRMP